VGASGEEALRRLRVLGWVVVEVEDVGQGGGGGDGAVGLG
jgi:hypothetical protein